MAFFKFRTDGEKPSVAPVQSESVDVLRRRAMHRLIGAAVLVLLGVIGFPLLFDKQPRPIPVDIAIEIPDRSKAKPLAIPKPVVPAVVGATPPPLPSAQASEPASNVVPPTVVASAPPPKTLTAAIVEPKADESVKVQALLEGHDPGKKPMVGEDRYVVQVGAFSDATRAREVRLKVEQAGLKTYTQVVETKEGRRIRVRVGPFADKAQADRATEKIKKLELPAALLNLSGQP